MIVASNTSRGTSQAGTSSRKRSLDGEVPALPPPALPPGLLTPLLASQIDDRIREAVNIAVSHSLGGTESRIMARLDNQSARLEAVATDQEETRAQFRALMAQMTGRPGAPGPSAPFASRCAGASPAHAASGPAAGHDSPAATPAATPAAIPAATPAAIPAAILHPAGQGLAGQPQPQRPPE